MKSLLTLNPFIQFISKAIWNICPTNCWKWKLIYHNFAFSVRCSSLRRLIINSCSYIFVLWLILWYCFHEFNLLSFYTYFVTVNIIKLSKAKVQWLFEKNYTLCFNFVSFVFVKCFNLRTLIWNEKNKRPVAEIFFWCFISSREQALKNQSKWSSCHCLVTNLLGGGITIRKIKTKAYFHVENWISPIKK